MLIHEIKIKDYNNTKVLHHVGAYAFSPTLGGLSQALSDEKYFIYNIDDKIILKQIIGETTISMDIDFISYDPPVLIIGDKSYIFKIVS